ncbi:MAG: prepilin-type N-terminal cleavage/methylation domain-containing protein [Phycisphaerae bacterium]|nr:prepilin-type N-terminal cleavage/methylation domain-containing protein [Phycisphaerae bacterium]
MQNRPKNRRAFTLIELLTVIAIIAALVGILSVAQRKVKIVSLNLRQKAAFHAGEISLELYSKDFGGYPDSSLVSSDGAGAGPYVTGSQRVAEALFGRDDRGFHPKSKWHPSLDAAAAAPHPGANLYTDATAKDRKTPYFERKRAGFYTINDLWGSSGFGSSQIYTSAGATTGTEMSPVFTDVFTQNRVTIGTENVKVGMPILYFKADPTKRFRVNSSNVEVDPAVALEYRQWVYNFDDNLPILQLPWLRDPTVETDGMNFQDGIRGHYKDSQDTAKAHAQFFYETITQRADGNFFSPHNKSTFLLISAGYDGIYGTKDDLTNFDD